MRFLKAAPLGLLFLCVKITALAMLSDVEPELYSCIPFEVRHLIAKTYAQSTIYQRREIVSLLKSEFSLSESTSERIVIVQALHALAPEHLDRVYYKDLKRFLGLKKDLEVNLASQLLLELEAAIPFPGDRILCIRRVLPLLHSGHLPENIGMTLLALNSFPDESFGPSEINEFLNGNGLGAASTPK